MWNFDRETWGEETVVRPRCKLCLDAVCTLSKACLAGGKILRAPVNWKAVPLVAQLLARPSMPDRFWATCLTNGYILVLHVAGLAWGDVHTPHNQPFRRPSSWDAGTLWPKMGRAATEEEEQISGLILLHLKCYSPLWTLACHTIFSTLDGLWPFATCSLFLLYLNLLQPFPYIFYIGFYPLPGSFHNSSWGREKSPSGTWDLYPGFPAPILVTVLTELTGCIRCC